MARAETSSLRLLRARVVRAESSPLFAVELLPYAVRRGHYVAFLEAMRGRRLRSALRLILLETFDFQRLSHLGVAG